MTGLHGAETAHLPDDRIRLPALRPRRECLGDQAMTSLARPAAEGDDRVRRHGPSTAPPAVVGRSGARTRCSSTDWRSCASRAGFASSSYRRGRAVVDMTRLAVTTAIVPPELAFAVTVTVRTLSGPAGGSANVSLTDVEVPFA
jgi:hypothetical protein